MSTTTAKSRMATKGLVHDGNPSPNALFYRQTTVHVRRIPIPVKGDQIIVWVSISSRSVIELESNTPRFPAILDTGNTMLFSMKDSHLRQWAGIDPRSLRRLGTRRHAGRVFPLHAARLWMHRNKPGTRDEFSGGPPARIEVQEGIVVYPDSAPQAPRLSLLGLRALRENNLHLYVNAQHRLVSLRTPGFVTRLMGLFS
jgi:hypothetical protein